MSAGPVSRRDFLRLRRSNRGKVLELSCRTLFMRCNDASAASATQETADPEDYEPSMGEPPARLYRRSATEVITALEDELRDAQVLRLIDPEWLDSIEASGRIEAAIDAFRLRGGIVERAS